MIKTTATAYLCLGVALSAVGLAVVSVLSSSLGPELTSESLALTLLGLLNIAGFLGCVISLANQRTEP